MPHGAADETETTMTTDTFHHDARTTMTTNALVQRYSDARDSFVVLSVEGDDFVMRDHRSGATHSLWRGATNEARLAAHWTGFCQNHGVTR